MPIKTRDLALDTLLLMVGATFVMLAVAAFIALAMQDLLTPAHFLVALSLPHLSSMTLGFLALLALLLGAAMAAAGFRGVSWDFRPGRLALIAALLGVVISVTSGVLLSWQQQSALHEQADYLLDNIQLNAEEVMTSRLLLMRRMAARIAAADGDLDQRVLEQDVQNYLRDAGSLQAIGLLGPDQRREWARARDDEDWLWLGEQLQRPEVKQWLAMPFDEPRLMEPQFTAAPGLMLMSIGVPRLDQQLVAVLDLGTMLANQLRLQMGPFHASISRREGLLLELRPPSEAASEVNFREYRMARRHIGLPGGAKLTLEAYPGTRAVALTSSMAPLAVALGGLTLSWLLAFSLGLVSLVMTRSRSLMVVSHQLEDQQIIQEMIARERPLEDTLSAICRMLEHQLPSSLCTVMLADDDASRLHLVSGDTLPEEVRQAFSEISVGPANGACGTAAFLGEPVICSDLATDSRWREYRLLVQSNDLHACWSWPVLGAGQNLLGTFCTYYRESRLPSVTQRDLIQKTTGLVALAVERHRVRRSLRESEQRYRSLFTYNPDAVFSLDRDGVFSSANDTCAEITGFAVEEILGAHFDTFVVPEDLPRIQSFFEAACTGETSYYELEIIVSNGARRTLELLNLPIMVDGMVNGVYGIAKDITERRHNETRLRVLERGLEASINGVIIADASQPDLPIIYANAAFVKMTGYSMDEVLGRNCRFLQGEDTDPEAREAIREALSEHQDLHLTLRNYRKDGSPFWNDIYISPIFDAEGRITHYVGVQHDISEHKAYEAQLAHHASHDALTGLANRALFEDRLDHDFALARRHGYRLAVLFIDLDDFKPINDSLGHAVGDKVLKELAQRMQSAMRAGDTVARLGGDEFVVIVPDIDQDMQVAQLVERLLPLIARPYRIDGHELYLTGSVGVAISDEDTLEPRQLIQQADMAMYQAKQQGRNAYQWFTREITDKVGQRVALRNDLQEAIDGQQFELHYQPLIDRDGDVSGVEALLRWPHPRRGYISPADFIPLAESTGQIIPISQWVLDRACRDMCALSAKGLGELGVAVNLSPLQFHRASFLPSLRHTLQMVGMAPSRLELELTEGILMNRTEAAIDILKALRSMQIGVSIDDFGTGFSSLSYLKYLPIGKVKIDRSFIHELSTSEHDAAIVQGIISMAHHLGLVVVAEGIETLEQYQQLRRYGCDVFQGFLLAKPMPLDRLEGFITEAPNCLNLTTGPHGSTL